jgi:spoIIIJ-associated protein
MREQQIERGKDWLENLLRLMGFPSAVRIEEKDNDPIDTQACWLLIESTGFTQKQTEMLIGPKGEVLDAIQYLANATLNLGLEAEDQQAFTVEINGYRLKRQSELLAWTMQIAEQVRQTGQEVEIKSLSSAERRQIHTFLKDADDLSTESRGQEPDRRLVIRLRSA